MPQKILLAHPYFQVHDPKQVRKMKPYPPLATLITAATVRAMGREVVLFDAMLASGEDEFTDLVNQTRPDIVGLLEDNFNFLAKMCTPRSREAPLPMIADAKSLPARVVLNLSPP